MSDDKSNPHESSDNNWFEENTPQEVIKNESEDSKVVTNDYDCDELSDKFENIIGKVAPALDNNPCRMKQFLNLFLFQRTLGYTMGLLSYDRDIVPEHVWNCKKLAKFVAIRIKWSSIISALSSNRSLLDQLQEYYIRTKNENKNLEFQEHSKMLGN